VSLSPRRFIKSSLLQPVTPHKLSTVLPPPIARAMPSDDSQKLSVKRQNHKWSPEEDTLIIELRGKGMKWEDISKRLPGRSAISCRLHYQNYLERRSEWDEERKNKLARLYERQVRSIEPPGVMTIHLLRFPLTRTKLTELQVQARNVG
jgi:hypothetical protein